MPKTYVPRPKETAAQCRERIVRRRKLGALVLLVGLVGLILMLSYTAFFPMANFEVSGGTRYSKSVLQTAAAVSDRTQLLNLSTDRIEQNLLRELPYLESVTVRRKLPHTLNITVADAKTVLAARVEDGWLILSGRGKVLELTEKQPAGTTPFALEEPFAAVVGGTIIFSADKEKDDWTRLVFDAFIAAYENCAYRAEITALDMKNPYYPTMTYQKRITLCLGSRDGFARQLDFALRTISDLDKEDKASKRNPSEGTLDLKVEQPQQSFFRWAE
jgi:hypothetical protein